MNLHEAIAALLEADPLVEGDGETVPLSSMANEPDGWCGYVSEIVDNFLSDAGFEIEPIMVNTGLPFIAIHYVTLVRMSAALDEEFIVDLTARQLIPPSFDRLRIPFPLVLGVEEYCSLLGVTIKE